MTEKFKEVRRDYLEQGACVRASRDLVRFMNVHFPGVAVSTKDMFLVAFDTVDRDYFRRPLMSRHGSEVKHKFVTELRETWEKDTYARSLVPLETSDVFSCVWKKDPWARKMSGEVPVYSHTCVGVEGSDVFIDWGFDQFLLPSQVTVMLCSVDRFGQ